MLSRVICGCVLVLLTLTQSRADVVIAQESFEAVGGDFGFTATFSGSGTADYFDRVANNGSRVTSATTSNNGDGSFAVGRVGGAANIITPFTITMNSVNVAGFTSLFARIRLATPDVNPGTIGLDSTDFLHFAANLDGIGFATIAPFESTLGGFNTTLSLDTNNDTNGNGNAGEILGHDFIDFAFPIVASSTVQLRAQLRSNAGGEYLFIDDMRVTGTSSVPEPSSFLFLGLVACGGMACRRKQRFRFLRSSNDNKL